MALVYDGVFTKRIDVFPATVALVSPSFLNIYPGMGVLRFLRIQLNIPIHKVIG